MELKIVLQKRNDEKPKKPAALAGFGINEAAPDSYCGLFEWVSYRVLEKVGLNPKKPFSFLKSFGINEAAPDYYRWLLGWVMDSLPKSL
ncbi:hypothetical protein C8N25_1061 [Algoriphagus antarcticus]|uniref:Uncharacterized protein n=1 Tax=Algoriphagus antarcticus TaxID=238540 RepID=A0A3E0DYG6_9BACT|nr:hypothetical protein [Algoriphagus antarcticus]REG90503.1 hypothetical protein C8N25_1061 [Algoriphagus antarcticus]